ncbi:TonB-dependent receptor domain-containing protein [Marinicaulis aureus]|uniref:TonB-dependent receptor domain-containing protein n=1 Tax=Hyphococcus aureus TaxID=2666033 RepID=A0ABW1L3P3_9PROT
MRGIRQSSVAALVVVVASAGEPPKAAAREDARVEETVHRFDIEETNAAAALNMLAEQAGAPILFPYDRVKSLEANALHAELTLEEALSAMLAGTGLRGSVSERGAIIVSFGKDENQESQSVSKKSSFLFTVSALAASAFLPQGASAQEGETTATAASNVDSITVTARRREENLQDTPVSISAFSEEALERQQIEGTEDLDMITPNLQFTSYGPLTGNNSAAQVFIRGIGQTDATAAVDPGVGIYMDDVYLGRAVGGAMEFRDIANVQVLRGPQGTLFGRNTIGGAVLLTTKDPGDEFGGELKARTGTDDLIQVFGALDLPLSDTLAARVSGGLKKRDGYVTRVFDGLDLGDDDTYNLNAKVRWEPTDAFSLTIKADYAHEDENGSPFVFTDINEAQVFPIAVSVGAGCPGAVFPPPLPVPNIDDPRCANDFYNLGEFTNGGNAPVTSTLESWGVSGHAAWEVNDVLTLKSISSYRRLEWKGLRDADNTPFNILTTNLESESKQFSQEVQALVDLDSVSGVIGGYYFDESTDDFTRVLFSPPAPPILAGAPGLLDVQLVDLGTKSFAFFTEWTWDLTEQLGVSGGIRYTDEEKSMQATIYNAGIEPIDFMPTSLPTMVTTQGGSLFIFPDEFTEDFSSVIGSASLQYRWNDNFLTYFSWSQGFKSGGFNERYNAATVDLSTGIPNNLPISFDEETANTYEIGFKSDFGGVFRLNASGFRTKYDDIQLIYRLGIVPLLFNAGTATISGFEAEFTYAPNRDFIVEGSVGYLRDEFKDIIAVPLTTATVGPGNSLPFTPSWSGHIGAAYTFHPTSSLELTPRVNLAITTSQFFDAANTVEVAQNDTVTVLNTSVKLAAPEQGWALTVGLQNATDELYPVAGNASLSTSTGYAENIYARPRNWFVELSYDF